MIQHQDTIPSTIVPSAIGSSAIVIEDDPALALIFAEILQEVGCNPQTINDGNAALQLLTGMTTPPNIILLDLNLPNVSGEQILRSIRENELLKETLVILTTANSRAASYLHNEADYVLLKPVSYTELSTLLNRLCSAHDGILVKDTDSLPFSPPTEG